MSISIQNLKKSFGSFTALNDVSLDIKEGELIALLGPSGSGKTTLLRIIAGLDFPTEGVIHFYGENAVDKHTRDRGVGFVFQHYALFRHMTIFENVAYGLRVKHKKIRPSNAVITENVNKLLSLVQLESLGSRYPHELSGGQRQRIALARALAVEPRFLLLDEPFGALDAKVREELRRWLRRLHDAMGLTSVFVTHDQTEALELADRVVVMSHGKIEQIGTPEEVVTNPASEFVYEFLGNTSRFDAVVDNGTVLLDGGARWPITRVALSDEASVRAYVRPWDFSVDRDWSTASVRARLIHRCIAGQSYRLEFESEAGLGQIKVEMPPEKFKAMDLKIGETLYLEPSIFRLFTSDGQLVRGPEAEIIYYI